MRTRRGGGLGARPGGHVRLRAQALVQLAVAADHHLLRVVALDAGDAGGLRGVPAGLVAQQVQHLGGQRGRVGDAHHGARRAQRRVVAVQAEQQLAARADIGGDRRHAGGKPFQHHQRQRLADRTQHQHPDLGQHIVDLLEAEELDALAQPQALGQAVAFLRVVGVFVFRAGDPAFGVGHLARDGQHGADERLHVLDRHHPADQAHHARHAGPAPVAQRGQARQIDAVGDVAGLLRRRAVEHLPQAVALVQRDDVFGGVIADPADGLEEAHPQVAEIADLRDVLLEDAAVVANPLALEQVDLAFLGVDAVLRDQQRPPPAVAQQRAQEPRVAGGDGVEHLHRDQVLGNAHQHPQRLVHDAHGPEVVGERRVGAVAPVVVRHHLPGAVAVEELLLGQRAVLAQVGDRGADQLGGLAVVGRVAQRVMQLARAIEGPGIAAAGLHQRRRGKVVQVVALHVHHVVGQGVDRLAVVFAAAADEDEGEADVRKGPDHLVDPARHPAAHIGKGPFKQQCDIGGFGTREFVGHDVQ